MRHHRLELIWNDWGDNCIYDKKSQSTTVLTYKSMPTSRSLQMKNLALINAAECSGRCGAAANELVFQVSSMKSLGEDVESLEVLPDSVYKQLLAKFPDLLKLSFRRHFSQNILQIIFFQRSFR